MSLLFPGCVSALRADTARLTGARHNILLVMTDDQGYGEIGAHGNPILRTPHLDALHSESLRFTRFHVSPTCAPTRAALFTGRHEFRSGITHTILERERLSLSAVTIAEVLRGAGYTTGIFGKWHLGDEDTHLPGRRGFDEVFIHGGGGIGQTYPGSCGDAPGNTYVDPAIWHNGRFERTRGYCTDVFFDQAGRWMESAAAAGRPFLAVVTPNVPHAPHVVPGDSWADPYRNRGLPDAAVTYYAMIAHLDAALGRLLAGMQASGLRERTVVVFLTDNGHSVGSVFNAGMRGTKGTVYEGGTRVPSFWSWPGRIPRGVDCDRLTAHVDVFPTLAELAGARVPSDRSLDGRSLLPLLADPSAPWADRLLVTHVGRWPTGEAAAHRHRRCAIRNDRFKLVDHHELYDLHADPSEAHDVSARHPTVVSQLRAAYDRWWDEVLPATRENEWAMGPYENPFKERFRRQWPGPKEPDELRRMDPALKFNRPEPRF